MYSNGTDTMKRYLIPTIFFAVGLMLQLWLYFSWITLGLLVTSTLLLVLLIFSLSEMSISRETVSSVETKEGEDHLSLSLPAPVLVELNDVGQDKMTVLVKESIFSGEDPIARATEIKRKEERQRFVEIVKEYILPIQNSKISSVLYAYFDGDHFTESIWQKGAIVIDSEPNEIEWEEFEETTVRRGLPCLSQSRQRLYLPIVVNAQVLGLVCMQTKDQFVDNEMNLLWLTTVNLAEKILEQRDYYRALMAPDTSLLNKAHFYLTTKDRFSNNQTQVMILMKLMKSDYQKEFAICLNEKIRTRGFTDIGLFQLEDQLLACFVPNPAIQEFTHFIQAFVEELDEMGYECEIALGYCANKTVTGKYDQWIKQAYISLESSILSNAA
jgi:hypothetical protein